MKVIELTRTTPQVERALRALREDGLTVGLGTVTETEHVHAAAAAGASFVVSFALSEGVIEAAAELGLTAIPGAFTPTEALRCLNAGAKAVKIFPARVIPPAYLGDLRAVMPDLQAVVTGGVPAAAEGIRPWLEAGALAVGVGSDLGTAATLGEDEVERRARELLAGVAGVAA